MRVAVSNIAWRSTEEPAVADRLVAVGVTGVEMVPTNIWPDPSVVGLAQAQAYGQWWARRGLPVVAAQSLLRGRPDLTLFGGDRARFVGYLGTVIDLCAAIGARALVFGNPANRRRNGLDPKVADAIAAEVFAALAARAMAAGTCLCLAPTPVQYGTDYLNRAGQAAALVRTVGSAGLRLHLDTAGMRLAGDDPATCAADFAPLLRHVHLSEPYLAPVGTPDEAHAIFAKALRVAGYDRYVSVKMRPAEEDAGWAVERAARYALRTYGDGA